MAKLSFRLRHDNGETLEESSKLTTIVKTIRDEIMFPENCFVEELENGNDVVAICNAKFLIGLKDIPICLSDI